MGFGITIIILTIIICATILFAVYMDYCHKSRTNIFVDPRYDERIRNLENEIKLLKENK